MARKGEDPMSGLLNNVGGIDAGLFSKPQSMRDMRGQQAPSSVPNRHNATTPPASKQGQSQWSSPEAVTARSEPHSWSGASSAGSRQAANQNQGTRQLKSGSADANKQLSAMLGESLSLNSQRSVPNLLHSVLMPREIGKQWLKDSRI